MSNWLSKSLRLGLRASNRRPGKIITKLLKKPLWPFQVSYSFFKLGHFELDQLMFLQHLLPETKSTDFQVYLNEIDSLLRKPEGLLFNFSPPEVGAPTLDEAAILYAIVRLSKPERVVETGAGSGTSSSFILAGLIMNRKGLLYSIDLPEAEIAFKGGPTGKPGWLIPKKLRSRWRLTLGKSEDQLLPLLRELDRVDIFFHDSLHYFRHQKFEYETAWPFIRNGGLLLSHDVSLPYVSLCRRLNASPINFQRLGGIRKGSQR